MNVKFCDLTKNYLLIKDEVNQNINNVLQKCNYISGDEVKTIRFGQQGVKTNQTAGQREAFKSRHAKNISKGKMSAAYWADKVKWSPSKTASPSKKWKKGS